MIAVAVRIARQIVLVLLHRLVIHCRVPYLRLDRLDLERVQSPSRNVILQLFGNAAGNFRLLLIVREYIRGVLGSHVVALAVFRRRIMEHVEETYQLLVVGLGVGQLEVEDLYVAGRAAAHLPVGRVLHRVGVGGHEPHAGVLYRAREALLKILHDELVSPPVTAGAEGHPGREGHGVRDAGGSWVGDGNLGRWRLALREKKG